MVSSTHELPVGRCPLGRGCMLLKKLYRGRPCPARCGSLGHWGAHMHCGPRPLVSDSALYLHMGVVAC